MAAPLWTISGVAALLYWAISLRDGHSWPRSAIKGLAVAPLALLALWQGGPVVVLALALCSLGDVILSRPGERAFLGGLIAFAAGHLVWIAAFGVHVGLDVGLIVAPLRLTVVVGLVLLAIGMARALLPRAGDLRLPVAGYIVIIIAMSLAALATPGWQIACGALLFAASDTLLGLQRFAVTRGTTAERAANALIWPLYWSAIALLTQGTLYLLA